MNWNDPWKSCVSGSGSTKDIATLDCIPVVFNLLIRAALVFAGVMAVFFIIYAGIKMATSAGDPKKVEGAKSTMTWAIIGLLIILFSFAILIFIGYITGTGNCINTFADVDKFLTGCGI